MNSSSSHYETLGVSSTATHQEIKSAFRRLCLETHPDVAHTNNNNNKQQDTAERFKRISEAHRVLSNVKERRLYDAQLASSTLWGQSSSSRAGFTNSSFGPRGKSPPPPQSGFHGFLHGFYQPRNVAIGVSIGLLTIMALRATTLGDSDSNQRQPQQRQQYHGSTMVQAWKNPDTGKWEQPAPWDPVYRRTKPALHMVPREKVQQRSFR